MEEIQMAGGAPRPTKMGNIVSPWRYDVAAYHTYLDMSHFGDGRQKTAPLRRTRSSCSPTMSAKEYRSTLSRRRSRSNFQCGWGFNFDRHRFDSRNRPLRFDFLADRRNRVTHFRDNALQIVSGNPKPPSQDSNLARVSQVNLVASGLRLDVAHGVSFDPD
jgi:hypothetical protein